jgi:hypothetical protein
LARETGKDVQAMKTTLELRGALAGMEQDLLRLEALRQVAARAAQKAGTPLPADEAGAEAAEAGAAKGVAGGK